MNNTSRLIGRSLISTILVCSIYSSQTRTVNAENYKEYTYEELDKKCEVLLHSENKHDATKCCKELTKLFPNRSQGYLCKCMNDYKKGKENEGLKCASNAEDKASDSKEICDIDSFKMHMHLNLKDYSTTRIYIKNFLEKCKGAYDKKDVDQVACIGDMLEGKLLAEKLEFDNAEKIYKRALQSCKDLPELLSRVQSTLNGLPAMQEHSMKNELISSFKERYSKLSIGMTKKSALNIIGVEPDDKKSISLKKGVFDCWMYYRDQKLGGSKAIVFMGGTIVMLGNSSCPYTIFQ